jgi:hypothetical protein
MDGSGPWYQRVSGGLSFTPTGTRFPCTIRVSFWRNSYTLGPTVFPPPASTLTENTIEVIVTQGALVTPDGRVITPADGAVAVSSVPLVSVSGDALSSDPRTGSGTVSFSPQCNNVETIFTIRATIRWNTKQRQHILYGIVRECYEESSPCSTTCGGSPPPSVLYLTISSAATTSGTFGGTLPNGTYAMDRIPGFCSSYLTWLTGCPEASAFTSYATVNSTTGITGGGDVGINYMVRGVSECGAFSFRANNSALVTPCGTGTLASGAGTWTWTPMSAGSTPAASGTLNWSVTA